MLRQRHNFGVIAAVHSHYQNVAFSGENLVSKSEARGGGVGRKAHRRGATGTGLPQVLPNPFQRTGLTTAATRTTVLYQFQSCFSALLQEMIDEADRDGDGEINLDEFLRIMKKTNLY
jgi:hypothetical protein